MKGRVLACPKCGGTEFIRTMEDKVRVLKVSTGKDIMYQDVFLEGDDVEYLCVNCDVCENGGFCCHDVAEMKETETEEEV